MEKLGFLINDTGKMFREVVREKAEKNGISMTKFGILMFLTKNEERIVVQKDIVEWTRLAPPTVSLTLQTMEADGLIEKKKSEDDSRKTILCLSEEGRKFAESLSKYFDEVETILENSITEDERKILVSCLGKMRKAMEVSSD